MKWKDVSTEEGTTVYEHQNTGKKMIVPVHYHVIEPLKFLSTFGTNSFLSPKSAMKGPGDKHGLSETFHHIVKKVGLGLMNVKGMGVRNFKKRKFHSLRHSFNSALADAGVPEEARTAHVAARQRE